MINRYSPGIKGSIFFVYSPRSVVDLYLVKNDASKQNVRTTNIVFRSKRVRNLNDSTPAKGASSGNIGRGPFKKNLVIPKDPLNKLKINVYTTKVIEPSLNPVLGSLG